MGMAFFLCMEGRSFCAGEAFHVLRGRRWKMFVAVENDHELVKLFMCCVGVDKKSLFERPNIEGGQAILRVLGAWSGH